MTPRRVRMQPAVTTLSSAHWRVSLVNSVIPSITTTTCLLVFPGLEKSRSGRSLQVACPLLRIVRLEDKDGLVWTIKNQTGKGICCRHSNNLYSSYFPCSAIKTSALHDQELLSYWRFSKLH